MLNFETTQEFMNSRMDFNEFGTQVLEVLKAGMPLFDEDDALATLLENIINTPLWKMKWMPILPKNFSRAVLSSQ